MPKQQVSVVIACRDDGVRLWRCVESVAAAGMPEEIVVVDDCSDDAPFRFMDLKTGGLGGNLVCHSLGKRSGLAAARNAGARAASGEILVFLDPGSAVTEGWLLRLTQNVANSSNSIVCPISVHLDERLWRPSPGILYRPNIDSSFDYRWTEVDDPRNLLLPTVSVQCAAMTRGTFDRLGGFDETASTEALRHVLMALHAYRSGGKVLLHPEVRIGFRFRGGVGLLDSPEGEKMMFCEQFLTAEYVELVRRNQDSVLEPLDGPDVVPETPILSVDDYAQTFIPRPADEESDDKDTNSDTSDAANVSRSDAEPEVRYIGFAESQIEIRTNVKRVVEHLDDRYPALLQNMPRRGRLELRIEDAHGGFLRLCTPTSRTGYHDLSQLRHALQDLVIDYFEEENHRLLWLHAGAAVAPIGAVVFVGQYGSGKSTLIVNLCREGWKYLSDDIIPIDPNSGKAWPFPLSPFFRPPPGRVLEPHEVLQLETETAIFAEETLSREPTAIAGFVFPRYEPDGDSGISAVPSSRALLQFFQHCFNLGIHGASAVQSLSRLFSDVPSIEIAYADGVEGARLLSLWASNQKK